MASRVACGLKPAGWSYETLTWVRRQRVQMWKRLVTPLIVRFLMWMLAMNLRLVRGALRCQRPVCWCRMLRPKVVPLPQTSHLVAIASQVNKTRASGTTRASPRRASCGFALCAPRPF